MKLSTLSIILVVLFFTSCASAPKPFQNEPQGKTTKYPIVLAHGFNASPKSMWGFNPDLIEALKDDGHQVYVTQVSPFNSVAKRAEDLKVGIDEILRCSGSDKVNIIAHSMGGLDARYLISRLYYANHVASLTTISTPHRGTYIADYMLPILHKSPDNALSTFTNFIGAKYDACSKDDCDVIAALKDMSEENIDAFNKATPDVTRKPDGSNDVLYQSWAGVSYRSSWLNFFTADENQKVETECKMDGGEMLMADGIKDKMNYLLKPIERVVSHGHGDSFRPNDGVVTVHSARWGRFRGCIPADHLDQVGQVNAKKDQLNGNTDFNYIRFYRTVAFELANEGK